ncbi:pilus-associated protein [Neisseria gonorrhoeae]|uniref:Pilus-associated protein n=1 Tax=Neisseria gonorrhoeae TaxID=485 RepID=A0A378W3P4_NEIGO|nr:pilus-associated protein [Neisseria gonorrhoeae]
MDLGTLRPRVETTGRGWLSFWATWKIEDKGNITVRLGLPEVKAGRCTNTAHPNSKAKPLSPALTAPRCGSALGKMVRCRCIPLRFHLPRQLEQPHLPPRAENSNRLRPARPAFPRRFGYAEHQKPRAGFQRKADRHPIAGRRVQDQPGQERRPGRGY